MGSDFTKKEGKKRVGVVQREDVRSFASRGTGFVPGNIRGRQWRPCYVLTPKTHTNLKGASQTERKVAREETRQYGTGMGGQP